MTHSATQTARAMVFRRPGEPLVCQSFPLPLLQAGEVLVRVTCCTVCGSDVSTYLGKRSTPVPTVLGHEVLGEVAALGPGQPLYDLNGHRLEVGDRITWSVAASCGTCFYCQHGLPQKCEQLFKYGHECCQGRHPLSGGMADYCHLAPGTAIVRVPGKLPDVVACPANCATATIAAAMRLAGDCTGANVLILGAGMLGLTAAAMAASRGAQQVLISDIDRSRLETALQFGATQLLDARQPSEQALEMIRQLTDGRGVDITLELSGATAAIELGLDALRIGGRCVWVGAVHPTPAVPIDPERVVRRMLSIQGLHNYGPTDLATAVDFLATHHRRFPFESLVEASFPLESADQAFAHAIQNQAVRVALTMNR